jgi:hypothetical protein
MSTLEEGGVLDILIKLLAKRTYLFRNPYNMDI